MRFRGFALAGAVAIVTICCQPALASTTTYDFTFKASGFTTLFDPSVTPPLDPVEGSFSLTFDPTQHYDFGDAGLTNFSTTLPLNAQSGTAEFLYEPSSQQLLLGMSYNGGGGAGSGSDDFIMSLFLGYPYELNEFIYYQAFDNNGYETRNVTFTMNPPLVAATPLPPSALMLVTSLGGLGFVGWRRRRVAP